jgi:hypothetical protein
MMADKSNHTRHEIATKDTVDGKGNMPGFLSRHPGWMSSRHVHSDIRAGISGSDDQNATLF